MRFVRYTRGLTRLGWVSRLFDATLAEAQAGHLHDVQELECYMEERAPAKCRAAALRGCADSRAELARDDAAGAAGVGADGVVCKLM